MGKIINLDKVMVVLFTIFYLCWVVSLLGYITHEYLFAILWVISFSILVGIKLPDILKLHS